MSSKKNSRASKFQRYLLPALVFQSIIIGGGYGTGRELVEFFLQYGPVGGLLGMLGPTLVLTTLCCMVGFEFARVFRVYDYRTFYGKLLGPGWVLYEIIFLVFILLIMAVLGSAAGSFLLETFGVPYSMGVVGLLAAVAFLVFKGTDTIEKFLAGWSFVLYAVYLVFLIWSISRFGDEIRAALKLGLAEGGVKDGWFGSGVRYAAGCVGLVPAVLFATRHIETRREALWAGFLTGPITMLPALFFYFAMLGQYPAVVDRPVPANYLLEVLGSRGFQVFFQVMLFGTLIETGSGLIHAFNERIASGMKSAGRSMPPWWRPAIAVVLLIFAGGLSRFGIINLIAKGYGTITWAYIFVVMIPILTIGVWKIKFSGGSERSSP